MSKDTAVCLDTILSVKGLTKEDLNRPIKSEHLNKIAVRIGDWKSCGAFLNIPSLTIDDIEDEERKVRYRRIKLFTVWQEVNGKNATYLVLAEVLAELGRRDLIERLLSLYHRRDTRTTSWMAASYRRVTELIDAVCNCKALFSILWKSMKLLFIIFTIIIISIIIIIATATNLSITENKADAKYHSTCEEGPSSNLAGLFWMNKPRCDSVSHDLPITNSPFVGREVEMNKIIHYIHTNTAHIININGAPGFGKSLLAIHIGYEMVKEGSTVRYIDAVDKLTNSKHFSGLQDQTEKYKVTHSKEESVKPLNSKAVSRKQPLSGSVISMKGKSGGEHTDIVVEQLLSWSEEIQCPTILILDNCDDLIYYDDVTRENLIQLVKTMVQNSKYQLHVIITSRQLLYILDDFESLVIKELSRAASVNLLKLLAPNISVSHAEEVTALIDGCPLALKVVGMLLHKQEDRLSEILHQELQQNPIKVLDKVSARKERFRVIMDLVYEQLGRMQECGHSICLFPGSFAHVTGSVVIPHDKCLDYFVEKSLLDKFYLADQTRYKMHLLIRQYFREKGNAILKVRDIRLQFEKFYCHYFTSYILKYANLTKATEKDQYLYSLEMHNIHHYLHLMIPKTVYTNVELAVLGYAIGENFITAYSVKNQFNIMMQNIPDMCSFLKLSKCGELFSYIIRQVYLDCRCENTYEYFKQFLHSPCMDLFQCQTVKEILNYRNRIIFLQLHEQEMLFLLRINRYHCNSELMEGIVSLHGVDIPIQYIYTCEYLVAFSVLYLNIDKFYLLPFLNGHLMVFGLFIYNLITFYTPNDNELMLSKWMEWLTVNFPVVIMHCIKFVIFAVLYSQYMYTYAVIRIRDYTVLEISFLIFPSQRVICTMSCIIVVSIIVFDIFNIFQKLFPICY